MLSITTIPSRTVRFDLLIGANDGILNVTFPSDDRPRRENGVLECHSKEANLVRSEERLG